MRLLLVDDEETLRDLLESALVDHGFDVTAAGDGAAALDLFRAGQTFDVIVLDLSMPRMDGPKLLATLRSEGQKVPAVLVGGLGRLSPEECAQLGVGPVLLKPFSIPQLLAAIEKARS
jgi:CheY-like chemotaxis protein